MQVQIAIQVIFSGIMLGRHLFTARHGAHSHLRSGPDRQFRPWRVFDDRHVHHLLALVAPVRIGPYILAVCGHPVLFLFGVIVYRFFFTRVINKTDEAKIFLTRRVVHGFAEPGAVGIQGRLSHAEDGLQRSVLSESAK